MADKEAEVKADEAPLVGRVIAGRLEAYLLLARVQDCLYGSVMAGVGLTTGDAVAIKSLRRKDIERRGDEERVSDLPETPLAEVFFAPVLHGCKNVAVIREVIGAIDFHFVISDFANGEDLLELLKQYPLGLPEEVTAMAMKAAAEGLHACHSKGVALQDFSLENCLLSYNLEGEYTIQLCDPGQAVLFRTNGNGEEIPVSYKGCVGKKFRPPEIFTHTPYCATKVDSWCLGWSCFYFLFAIEIFESVHPDDNDPNWNLCALRHYNELFQRCGIDPTLVSETSKDFVFRLLDPSPITRMSIAEALNHPFLRTVDSRLLRKSLFPASEASDDPPPKAHERLMLELLSLSPPGDRPRLLRTFSLQLPVVRKALHSELMRPLAEIESRARTIRRLLAEQGPHVPKRYFTYYLMLFCRKSKPSHCLLTHYDALLCAPPTARGGSESPRHYFSVLAKKKETSSAGGARSSRVSPRSLLVSPLTRRIYKAEGEDENSETSRLLSSTLRLESTSRDGLDVRTPRQNVGQGLSSSSPESVISSGGAGSSATTSTPLVYSPSGAKKVPSERPELTQWTKRIRPQVSTQENAAYWRRDSVIRSGPPVPECRTVDETPWRSANPARRRRTASRKESQGVPEKLRRKPVSTTEVRVLGPSSSAEPRTTLFHRTFPSPGPSPLAPSSMSPKPQITTVSTTTLPYGHRVTGTASAVPMLTHTTHARSTSKQEGIPWHTSRHYRDTSLGWQSVEPRVQIARTRLMAPAVTGPATATAVDTLTAPTFRLVSRMGAPMTRSSMCPVVGIGGPKSERMFSPSPLAQAQVREGHPVLGRSYFAKAQVSHALSLL